MFFLSGDVSQYFSKQIFLFVINSCDHVGQCTAKSVSHSRGRLWYSMSRTR